MCPGRWAARPMTRTRRPDMGALPRYTFSFARSIDTFAAGAWLLTQRSRSKISEVYKSVTGEVGGPANGSDPPSQYGCLPPIHHTIVPAFFRPLHLG